MTLVLKQWPVCKSDEREGPRIFQEVDDVEPVIMSLRISCRCLTQPILHFCKILLTSIKGVDYKEQG